METYNIQQVPWICRAAEGSLIFVLPKKICINLLNAVVIKLLDSNDCIMSNCCMMLSIIRKSVGCLMSNVASDWFGFYNNEIWNTQFEKQFYDEVLFRCLFWINVCVNACPNFKSCISNNEERKNPYVKLLLEIYWSTKSEIIIINSE